MASCCSHVFSMLNISFWTTQTSMHAVPALIYQQSWLYIQAAKDVSRSSRMRCICRKGLILAGLRVLGGAMQRRLFSTKFRELDQSDRAATMSALKVLRASKLREESVTPGEYTKEPERKYGFIDIPAQLGILWRVKPPVSHSSPRLFSRSCYTPIFNAIYKHNMTELRGFVGGIVVLGNPGIGKTGFFWYSVWKLLHKKERIIMKLPTASDYFCMTWSEDGELVVAAAESALEALAIVGRGAWYLADRFIGEHDWNVGEFKFLLTCSPSKDNYKEFAKGGLVQVLYDPVWSLDELLAVNEHNFGHDVRSVKERFDRWGGIPRYVLEKTDKASQKELDVAVGLVRDVDQILDLQSLPETQSHKVFHMLVDENSYDTYQLGLASPWVKEQVYSKLPAAKLRQLVNQEQPELIKPIQGHLFEIYVTRTLVKSKGSLLHRQLELSAGGELVFGPVQKREFLPMEKQYDLPRVGRGGTQAQFPELFSADDKGALFKPEATNNAEWDFILHGSIFQVTIKPTRPLVLGDALEKALSFLRKCYGDQELEFCFIVPPYLLSKFKIAWWAPKKENAAEQDEADEYVSKKAKGASKAQIAQRIAAARQRIAELNINITVASFEARNICPRCNGQGVLLDEATPVYHEAVDAVEMLQKK